jgi:hypothetical protein
MEVDTGASKTIMSGKTFRKLWTGRSLESTVPGAKPRHHKARTVPYAYRQSVEEELDRLVAVGILEPIDSSDWAAPIVPVIKSDKKSVRICGDFRVTVNPVSRLNRYPIPKIEDLFATSENGKSSRRLISAGRIYSFR